MESGPIKTFNMLGKQGPSLESLFLNDLLFDKFEARFNHDGTQVLTGAYQNKLHVLSTDGSQPNQVFEASRRPHRQSPPQTWPYTGELQPDFFRRIPHASFHPRQNLVAIAATSALYIMNAT
jgi:serine/threonine-protein phosphatase 2A regulatory subunit B